MCERTEYKMEFNNISSKRNDSDRTNLDLSPLAIAAINLGDEIDGWEEHCCLRNTILEEEEIVWNGTDAFDPDDEFSEKPATKPTSDTLQSYFRKLTEFKFIQHIKDKPKIFGGIAALLVVFLVVWSNTSFKQSDVAQKSNTPIKAANNIEKNKNYENKMGSVQQQKNTTEQIRSENRRKVAQRIMEERSRGITDIVYLGKYFYDAYLGDSGIKVSDLEKQLGLQSPGKDGLEVMIVDAARSPSGQVGLKLIGTTNYVYHKNIAEWWVSVDDTGLVVFDPFIERQFSNYKAKREKEMARQDAENRKEELAKANSARDAFINFHRAITNRQLQSAFDILSPNYQRFMRSYESFARGYDTTLRSDVVELNTIHEDGNSATFTYKLKAVDREGTGQKVQYFVGKAKLIKINGQWRIDSTEAKVASANSRVTTNMATIIAKGEVNLRATPTTNANSVGVVREGDWVELLETGKCNDSTAAIVISDDISFGSGSNRTQLSKGMAIQIVRESGGKIVCKVNVNNRTEYVNFAPNHLVKLYGTTWYKVRSNGSTGWIYSNYARKQ